MTEHGTPNPSDEPTARPGRRRLLLGGGLAVMATGALAGGGGRADAAAGTTAWILGGNNGVSTDASNFLGPRNVAPLVFKTAVTAGSPVERMRITPEGLVGVGTTTPGAGFESSTASAVALQGRSTGTGTGTVGVKGLTKNGSGVVGTATGTGVGVRAISTSGAAVDASSSSGVAVQAVGDTYGVYGRGAIGVLGGGTSYGVYGSTSTSNGIGVYGSATLYGVYGSGAYGLYGFGGSGSTSVGAFCDGLNYGVFANGHSGTGVYASGSRAITAVGASSGLFSQAPSRPVEAQAVGGGSEGIAVFGDTRGSSATANKYAGYFVGDTIVFGTLSKSAGSFKIDHPLDPDHTWLSHSFVESPDMMNVYNGNVVLGADGTASVDLPDYFTALNRDYRYQLTCLGAHAPVYVSRKVSDNSFSIAGGTPGLEVSWQVTGIRQDAYAKAHPIVVEEPKTGSARGGRAFVPPGSGARSGLVAAAAAPAPHAVPTPDGARRS